MCRRDRKATGWHEEDTHHCRTQRRGNTTFAQEFLPNEAACPEFFTRNHYIGLVDAWTIYDARQTQPQLIETGENPETLELMEDTPPSGLRSQVSALMDPITHHSS